MSSQTIEMKFNELLNNMNIKLINRLKLHISLITKNIDNRKSLKIKATDSSIQNKKIAFCSDLCFGIFSFNSYLDTR